MVNILKVFIAVELHLLKSQKVICSNTACSLSMRPILINNCNVTGNSVEKQFFAVLNVELEVKFTFKTIY